MDGKSNDKSWVGNIYNQFEAICQDVDGFMTKESVKYVENQVQSVGVSVKRFYSNVVQDMLPPSRDTLTEMRDGEEESVTRIRGAPTICVIEDQFSTEQGSVVNAALRNSLADPLRNDGDSVGIWNDFDYDSDYEIEDDITIDSIPAIAADSTTNKEILLYQPHDEGNKKEMMNLCNRLTERDSKISKASFLFKGDLPSVESIDSDDISHKEDTDAIRIPLSSDYCDDEGGQRTSGGDGTHSDDTFLTKIETLDFPYFSSDDKQEDRGFINNSYFASANFAQKAENIICGTDVDSNVCAQNVNGYSSFSEIIADVTKKMDMLSSVLNTESNDNKSPLSHGSVSGSSNSDHEHCHEEAQSKIANSPSKTDISLEFGVGRADLDMETVDLSTDVRHDDKDLILNGNFVHTASYRKKDFSYYKNLIHDAFAARKRLSKEYKHLAILYGEIDMESRHHFEKSPLSPSTSTSVNANRTMEMSESEWELL